MALGRQHAAYDPRRFRIDEFGCDAADLERVYHAFFEEHLGRADAVVLVAAEAEAIVGYALARLEPANLLDLSGASGWLHDLYVSEAARGRRVGSQLLDAALHALRALGAKEIMLSVSPKNDAARRLFERRGFGATMVEHRLIGDGRTVATPARDPYVRVGAEHLDDFLELVAKYYAFDDIAFDRQAVRRGALELLASPHLGGAWLVRDGDRFVGHFVVAFGIDLEFGGRQATVTELYLDDGARRRGLGTGILRFVESMARELGIHALELQVDVHNDAARAFYERAGFEAHGRVPMSKRLAAR